GRQVQRSPGPAGRQDRPPQLRPRPPLPDHQRLPHREPMSRPLDPDLLLHAYRIGAFPMADSVDAEDVYWVEPRRRGIIPLDGFHLSRSLAKTVRQERFEVTVDTDFAATMRACA